MVFRPRRISLEWRQLSIGIVMNMIYNNVRKANGLESWIAWDYCSQQQHAPPGALPAWAALFGHKRNYRSSGSTLDDRITNL